MSIISQAFAPHAEGAAAITAKPRADRPSIDTSIRPLGSGQNEPVAMQRTE